MKKEKLNEKIVCDTLGCGCLSAYRLTFDKGASIFLCQKCYSETKEFFVNEEESNKKARTK